MAELHVIGYIDGAFGFESPNLFCKWSIETGSNWRLLEGEAAGQTQIDFPVNGGYTVWSHPVDVHYASRGIQGWPKISMQVWHQDSFGRNELAGYGVLHVPTAPGTYDLEVVTWRPLGSLKERLSGWFLGGKPQLRSEELISSSADRYRLETVTEGRVNVSLSVITKDFEQYGVSFK